MNRSCREYLSKIVHCLSGFIPDKKYLEWVFFLEMNRKLSLENPQTMNEKLQWLKLYYRLPEMTQMVDKLEVKKIIAQKIGIQYVAPVLQIWDSVEDVDITQLPNQFVLKTNHSGGNMGVVICEDKNNFSFDEAKKKLHHSWNMNIYKRFREWPYKNVKRKVFAEHYLGDNLVDYKFYCFDGDVDCCLVCVGRQEGDTKYYFFDKDWKLKMYNKYCLAAPKGFTIPKPSNYDKMVIIAEKLTKGFPFLRIDFFEVNGKMYFGEFTFFPASGYGDHRLPEADAYFGKKMDLSLVYKK